eukprot:XP_001703923.1 Hypothetical protein GL50803_97389 [Giardia lamblia ATCC 50803]
MDRRPPCAAPCPGPRWSGLAAPRHHCAPPWAPRHAPDPGDFVASGVRGGYAGHPTAPRGPVLAAAI